ncbi:MAG: hypothetical protein AAGB22_12755 [Bacteroidota bacterium]
MKRSLPAYSLIETAFAMTIILAAFTIGSMVYLNVIGQDGLGQRDRALEHLHERALEISRSGAFLDQETTWNTFTVVETFEPYDGVQDLVLMHLHVRDERGQLLAEVKQIIPHVRED